MLLREFIVAALVGGTLVLGQIAADTKVASTKFPYRLVV